LNFRGVWIIPLILCAGCASAPDRKAPPIHIHVPGSWTAGTDSSAAAPPDTWWTSFDDTTLNTVVTESLDHNFDLVAAAARVEQSAAQGRIAAADLWPQLNANGTAARTRTNILGFPTPSGKQNIEIRSSTFGVSLDLGWELDLWGRLRKGHAAAAADVEAAWADFAAARLSIAAQTAHAYFAVVASRLQVNLAQRTVESYDRSARRVRARYEQGVRGAVDLRIARASLQNGRAALEMRRRQFDVAARELEILMGRYPSARITTAVKLPDVAGPVPAGLPSLLLIRRPDLLAAERRYAAAEARVSQARRAFFPRITLTGSGGTQSNTLRDITNLDFGVWRLAAGLVQPIFQGGRLRANLSLSHAVSDQALAHWAQAMLRAFGDVETALTSEKTLAARETFVSQAAHESEAAQRLAERQYASGLIDYITLLETQRQTFAAQSEQITARRELLDARVNLYLALGGGFDARSQWTEFLESHTPAPSTSNGGSR